MIELADRHGVGSVAMPSIPTGIFRYPMRDPAEVALGTIVDMAPGLKSVRRVRMVLYDGESLRIHQEALARTAGPDTD